MEREEKALMTVGISRYIQWVYLKSNGHGEENNAQYFAGILRFKVRRVFKCNFLLERERECM